MGRKSAIGVVVLALAGVLSLAPVARASTAPTQKSPADGATLAFPGHPAVFSWSRVRGATTYRIQIDDAPDFVGPQEYTTSNRSFTLTEPQTVGTTFFWRVQATLKTGKNTAWSAVRRYTISWNSKPQLMEPADNSTVVDIVLSWHPVAGAATYQVQVSPNGDWANNVVVDQVVRGTRYSPLTTLPNGTYFWRVRARDGAYVPNLGAWSEERQFVRAWTDAPSLQSPPNQLSPSVDVPTFKWSPTPRASDYRLEVGTDPNFSPNTFTDCDTNHTQFTYYEVPNWFYPGSPYPPGGCGGYPNNFKGQPGTTFYWRVRGIDEPAHAYGPWSQVWQFVFRGASSDVPPLQSPANGASVSDPLLQWSPVPSYPVERYQVTILLNGNQVQQTKTAGTSFTPSNLSLNTTYSWYVQTVDGYGQVGVLGSQRTFTVVAPGSTSPAPDPTGPANGSSSLRMPAMSWDPVANLDHYEVWYGIQGTGVVHRMATGLMFPSFTYADDALPPGQYIWYVIADLKNNTAVQGTIGNFIISSLQVEATSDYLSPPHCAPGTSCTPIGDTPTLKWNSVPSAGSYLVYIAIDPGFTNVVRVYATNYTELTPRESLLDNQAGQAYYWFVRPCKTPTTCGPAMLVPLKIE